MSTIIRAKTKISAVIPSFMESAVETVAKRRNLKTSKSNNKVTIHGGAGSYDRTNFEWKKEGTGFQANYDDMHQKTSKEIIDEVQGQYTTILVSAIAAEDGFDLVSCERRADGSFDLMMER